MALWSNTHLHKGQRLLVSELGEQHPVLTKDRWSGPLVPRLEWPSHLVPRKTVRPPPDTNCCSSSQGSPARQMLAIPRLKRNTQKKAASQHGCRQQEVQDLNNVV